MIQHGGECLAVAQQLQAVVSAIGKAKSIQVQDHIEHCLGTAIGQVPKGAQKSLQELKEITKYL